MVSGAVPPPRANRAPVRIQEPPRPRVGLCTIPDPPGWLIALKIVNAMRACGLLVQGDQVLQGCTVGDDFDAVVVGPAPACRKGLQPALGAVFVAAFDAASHRF